MQRILRGGNSKYVAKWPGAISCSPTPPTEGGTHSALSLPNLRKDMKQTLLPILGQLPYSSFRPVQEEALELALNSLNGFTLEIPTGEGKAGIGIALALKALADGKTAFYVVPTKQLVDQICREFPRITHAVYGRAEYECLYYHGSDKSVSAAESPCYMLKCPHRVNQETGETQDPTVEPCPYYLAKHRGLQAADTGKIIVCTTAFFLMNRLLVGGWNMENVFVVFDEGHGIAEDARGIFEHNLTDYHLKQAIAALETVCPDEAQKLQGFLTTFSDLARAKLSDRSKLLTEDETARLLSTLRGFDNAEAEAAIRDALQSGVLDPVENREVVKTLETAVRGIPRFLRSLQFALPKDGHNPLNYVVAFWYKRDAEDPKTQRRRVEYCLSIKTYFVAPLIRKAAGDEVIAMSATIGEPRIFGFETGLTMPHQAFTSSFDVKRTRIYMPSDTPNLSHRKAGNDGQRKAEKQLVETAVTFKASAIRSLIVVVSEEERLRISERARKAGLVPMTYGAGGTARQISQRFKSGEGDVLIGTFAQYGEGTDLPGSIAQAILVLRPGYQRPDDPMTQFELRRFTQSHCWSLWNYRVMQQALQVRGRNIRTLEDCGVTIFFSQQFSSFLYGSLPEWLKPAYVGKKPLEQCIQDALNLLTPA